MSQSNPDIHLHIDIRPHNNITYAHTPPSIPVETRRRFNVYKTSIRHRRRRIDVL